VENGVDMLSIAHPCEQAKHSASRAFQVNGIPGVSVHQSQGSCGSVSWVRLSETSRKTDRYDLMRLDR